MIPPIRGVRHCACLTAVVSMFHPAIPAFAAPGDLDSTFSLDGKLATDFGSGFDFASDIAIQSDGKIVVIGSNRNTANYPDFVVARYNPDGTLDTGFGINGIVLTDFGGTQQHEVGALLLQPDGKIVVGGSFYDNALDFALVRYNPNGTLDTGFGGDGKIATNFIGLSNDQIASLVLQPDGKIVAFGSSDLGIMYNSVFAMARYNADGSLDAGFDGDGITTLDIANGPEGIVTGLLQPDGKLIAVGKSNSFAGDFYALVRYLPNGTLDATYGTGGIALTPIPALPAASDQLADAKRLPDGKVVTAGGLTYTTMPYGTNTDFVLGRFNSNGSLDTTFGNSSGWAVHDLHAGANDYAFALAVQPDGKLVAAGRSFGFGGADSDFSLARYDANGSLDATFAGDGTVRTDLFSGSTDVAFGLARQSDGKFVVAGRTNTDWGVARYEGDTTDASAPVTSAGVTPAANTGGWHNTNVTVSLTATDDGGSGVKEIHHNLDNGGETITAGASANAGVNGEGIHDLRFFAVDNAGNTEIEQALTVKIDTTAPQLVLPGLAPSQLINSTVTLSFDANDTLSGVASLSATLNGDSVLSGAMLNLTQAGPYSFALTATDYADNTATGGEAFSVIYGFGGFLPPLTADSRAVFKLGSVIPVKFRLLDANDIPVSTAVASLVLQQFSGEDPVGDPVDAIAPGGADSGNLFRYADDHYVYNLNTRPLSAGTWELRVVLDDGTVHAIQIGLKSK